MTAPLQAQFERCLAWLAPAIAHGGEETAEAVLAEVLAGRAQLWPGEAAALVTQCVRTGEGGTIHAWLGGGSLDELLALRHGVEAFGRAMGCTWATIEGRRGWERLYRPCGYHQHGGLLRKRL